MNIGCAAVQRIASKWISQMRKPCANLMATTAPNKFHFHQVMNAVNQSLLYLPAATSALGCAAFRCNGHLA